MSRTGRVLFKEGGDVIARKGAGSINGQLPRRREARV